VKSADHRQSSTVSTPESSVSSVHPLPPQWQSSTEAPWTSSHVIVSRGQQVAGNAFLPVLPINLLSVELSSLLGMPVSDSRNVQDPLASLSRLSTGIQNIAPATNVNNNMVTTESNKVPENAHVPHTRAVIVKPEIVHVYGNNRSANATAELGNRIPEPRKLPGGLDNVYATVKSEHPQQASTEGSQFPLVTGPSQPVSSSVYFPALHQLLQHGTTNQSIPPPLPASTKVSESVVPVGTYSSPITPELTGRRRWTSADSAVDRHSNWGYADYSASLFRQESSGFDISKNSSSPDPQSANADKDAAEFSAPSGLGLHHKFRRKNRPQPLIIPSPVGHFGFQSRLRSPRVSDQSGPGLSSDTSSSAAATVPLSLAVASFAELPYTPPPMLSPVRTGSGLFCSLVEPSPKSAPVGFRLGLVRCSK